LGEEQNGGRKYFDARIVKGAQDFLATRHSRQGVAGFQDTPSQTSESFPVLPGKKKRPQFAASFQFNAQ
jgi:hypothetical protein